MMTQFVPRYMYMSFDYITGYDVIEKHYRLGGRGDFLHPNILILQPFFWTEHAVVSLLFVGNNFGGFNKYHR